jgi:hypothetical protein
MSSNILNEIKNSCLHKKIKIMPLQVEPILVKSLQVINTSQYSSEKVTKPVLIKNKLITCYEEDYTRNTNEIMSLWQRN